MGFLAERITQASGSGSQASGATGQVDEREQAIIDRYKSGPVGSLRQKLADVKAYEEIDVRKQQRAYAEKAPRQAVEPVKEMLSNLGNRAKVLEIMRTMTPEQQAEALKLAPGVSQQLGDDRGGAIARTAGAIGRGISHGVSQPAMELMGQVMGSEIAQNPVVSPLGYIAGPLLKDLGGTPEEIEYIRQLDAAASQELSPARPGDPWYERGPLQAAEMAPWMATVVGAGGAGRAITTAAARPLAGRMALATGLGRATLNIAGKTGELAGITAAAFPGQYAQEVDQLKELGMEDGTKLRLLAAGTATVSGLIEGIVPNPIPGKVSLTEGAVKAARQYLWEAAKKAPGEMSEEYLQGVTSGLGEHIAQYLDKNAESKSVGDAFVKGWEQAKEAALPMAFLLGVPAVGGAGLNSLRAQQLSRLKDIRAKGFVSEADAKEAGIEGKNRKERLANADAKIKQLEEAAQGGNEIPPTTPGQPTVPPPVPPTLPGSPGATTEVVPPQIPPAIPQQSQIPPIPPRNPPNSPLPTPAAPSGGDAGAAVAGAGKGVVEGLYQSMFDRLQAGQYSGIYKSPADDAVSAEHARQPFQTPEEIRQFVNDGSRPLTQEEEAARLIQERIAQRRPSQPLSTIVDKPAGENSSNKLTPPAESVVQTGDVVAGMGQGPLDVKGTLYREDPNAKTPAERLKTRKAIDPSEGPVLITKDQFGKPIPAETLDARQEFADKAKPGAEFNIKGFETSGPYRVQDDGQLLDTKTGRVMGDVQSRANQVNPGDITWTSTPTTNKAALPEGAIGLNSEGKPIFEDELGVRSIGDGDARAVKLSGDKTGQPPAVDPDVETALGKFKKRLGVEVTATPAEKLTGEQQEVLDFANSRGQKMAFVSVPKTDKKVPIGTFYRQENVVLIREDLQGDKLWGTIGHEMAHSKGLDSILPADSAELKAMMDEYYQLASPEVRKRLMVNKPDHQREGRARMVQKFFENKQFRDELKKTNPTMWDKLREAVLKFIGQWTPKNEARRMGLEELRVAPKPEKNKGLKPPSEMTEQEKDAEVEKLFGKKPEPPKTIGELRKLTFDSVRDAEVTEGVGKNKGVTYRRKTYEVTDENGKQRRYKVTINDRDNDLKIEDLGITKEQQKTDEIANYDSLKPETKQKIIDIGLDDNLSYYQKYDVGLFIEGRTDGTRGTERAVQITLGGAVRPKIIAEAMGRAGDATVTWEDVFKFLRQTKPKTGADIPASSKGFSDLPKVSRSIFETAMQNDTPDSLLEILHSGNKTMRAEFESRTGVKLPKTVKGTKQVIEQWFKDGKKPATKPSADQVDSGTESKVKPETATDADLEAMIEAEFDTQLGVKNPPKKLTGKKSEKPKVKADTSKYGDTPIGRQFAEAKAAGGDDTMLLFRMGDFYELYFEDAQKAAKLLGLTLVTRDKSADNPILMAGFPHHQIDGYLKKLKSAGIRVAINEEPFKAKQPTKKRTGKSKTGIQKAADTARQEADDLWAELNKESKDKLTTGLNPDLAKLAVRVALAEIKAGTLSFAAFVEQTVAKVPADMLDKLKPYMEMAWKVAHKRGMTDDPGGKFDDVLAKPDVAYPDGSAYKASDYGTVEKPNRVELGKYFAGRFAEGASYARITDARKEAAELIGGTPKDGTSAIKDIDEAVEIGVVRHARDIAQSGLSDSEIYDQLVDLYTRQPNLGTRTSTSMAEQAYSTPAPLAYVVNRRAGVTSGDTVYDSSAGNGMLLIVGGTRYANELNPTRAESLRGQGIETTSEDATEFELEKPIDALIINPPFGQVKNDAGKPVQWNIDGVRTDKIDHAITLQSLNEIPEDGKAAIIIGAKGFEKREPKADSQRGVAYLGEKKFYDTLYDNYNVVDHFTVHGDLYSRQGASFPVDVIVIDGKGKSQRPKPYNITGGGIPSVIKTWEELKDAKLRSITGASSASTRGSNADNSASVGSGNEIEAKGDAKKPSSKSSGRRVGGKDRGVAGSEGLGKPSGQPGVSNAANGEKPTSGEATGNQSGRANPRQRNADRPGGPDSSNRIKPDETAETSYQVSYRPGSKNASVDTLIPRNHQSAVTKSLESVADIYGDIDEFVASELGYSMDELQDAFSAEQVDALALAIARHKDGGAFIIGDQTGVGKGRAAAAMMVYANRQGLVPVFVTEKPTLYADMVRDLIDIGKSTEDAPFNVLMTNSLSGKDVVPLPDGRSLKQSPTAAQKNLAAAVESVLDGGILSVTGKGKNAETVEYNAIFTTYSQLQPVKQIAPERFRRLKSISERSFYILDESHNAGGGADSGQEATVSRAELVRDLIGTAAGVYFSSATYAKSSQTMGLYARTGMTAATNNDAAKLSEAIATGGVPLQQVVSEQLVESGMYLRRERSFDGVEFAHKTVGVDLSNLDNVSAIFDAINNLDKFAQEAIQALQDEITSAGGAIRDTEATGQAGIESTSFSSILHNLVDQMLLSVKADAIADETIASIKAGESPVIYVDSTLEAALKRQVDDMNVKTGDEIDFSYRDLVRRYLERSREYTVRRDLDNSESVERVRLTDEQLGPGGVAAYERALDMIANFEGDMPASPIDWIRKRVSDAGYSIGEITGRQVVLEYGSDGKVRLGKRPDEEAGAGGRTATVAKFNAGELDAVLINPSGSTGISMHASEKFKNQKPRHMIIGQPSRNIDTFMQALGRVHRTGQVVLPRFTLMMTDAPAEIRPASVLVKKLASLNANVTASAKGSVSFDVPDVINIIGDQIVAEYLADNPALDLAIGEIVSLRSDGTPRRNPGIAKKASGRMALRPVSEQQMFWDSVVASYNELVDELNRIGKNPLVAATLDLQAKTLESTTIFEGDATSANAFLQPASIELVRANKPGTPMTSAEVTEAITTFYGKPVTRSVAIEWLRATQKEVREAYAEYSAALTKDLTGEELATRQESLEREGNRRLTNLMNRLQEFAPGMAVSVYDKNGDGSVQDVVPGFVTKVKRSKGGNPLASSKWSIEVAIASPDRVAKSPLSRTGEQQPEGIEGYREFLTNNELINDKLLKEFEETDSSPTEQRYIGVGNILAAYSQLGKAGGQITFFTDANGNVRRGVLMPRSFNVDQWADARPVVLDNVSDVRQFLASGSYLNTPDKALNLMMIRGDLVLRAPKAKSRGGKYTLNSSILSAAAPLEFVSIGSRMEMVVQDKSQQDAVLSAVMSVASLQADSDKNLARQIKQASESLRKTDTDTDVLYQKTNVDPQIVVQATDLAIDAQDAGIESFDELVAFSVKTVGEQRTRDLGQYLAAAGDMLGLKGIRPIGDVIGMPGVSREQAMAFAKAAFPMLTDEQIEAGLDIQDATAFGRDQVGFAPFGTPVPGQSLKQIKPVQTDTPAFKKWFGDSKVVGSDGKPLLVYHGTTDNFTVFDKSKANTRGGKIGFFFTPDTDAANKWSERNNNDGGNVMPVFLSIKNPLRVPQIKWVVDQNPKKYEQLALKNGHDGILLVGGEGSYYGSDVWVALQPEQIKSAIGNRGTFDPSNPNILMARQEQSGDVKGWTQFISATRAIIGATSKADVSTFIHEFFHPMRKFLLDRNVPEESRAGITDEDIKALEDYAGAKDGKWTVESEEKAAKAWEQYWFEGKSPTTALRSLFEKIARWMRGVYRGVHQITGGQLPAEVRQLFDKIVQRGGISEQEMPQDDNLTSIKNEVMNDLRSQRGLPELADVAAQTQQEWIDTAEARMRAEPGIADRLVKAINASPRNLSNIEVAILQLHYRHVNNELASVSDRLFGAKDSGDTVEAAKAQREVDIVMNALAEIEDASKAAGREWGRAGVSRQIVLRKDFSLAGILRKARIANAGNVLSAEQQAEMIELAKRVAELEGKLAKAEQEKLDLERQRNVERTLEEERKRPPVVRTTARKKASEAVSAFKQKFANIFSTKSSDTLLQTEDELMAEAAQEVVEAYVKAGVFSFGEFIANVQRDLGELPARARVAFATAWEDAKMMGEIPTPDIDVNNAAGMTRLARRIQRSLVEAGITDRDKVVEAVHESLQELVPDITRRETMDALSGYGQYSKLSQAENDKIIRDINGQLQQLAKLEDMRSGQAPSKTGGERRTPSDEERRLIKEVNEAKRRGGFIVTDPQAQLKTAMDAAKTAVRNRISDLEYEIQNRQRIVRTKTELTPDTELDSLRKKRDSLLDVHKTLFPKPGATMEQRIAAANRAIDASIADLEERLKKGDVTPIGRKEPVSTPELEVKRARLKALQEQRDAIRALANPKMTPEERSDRAYKASLLKRIADYQERMVNSEFAPRPQRELRILTPEQLQIKKQLEEAKDHFFKKAAEYRLANMSPIERAWDYIKETSHLSRAIMTSFDLSAVFRQGGVGSMAHPVLAAKISRDMLKALMSSQAEFNIAEEIRNDPMYQFAMTAKLAITEEDGKITRQEEAFMGRWARHGIGKTGTKVNAISQKALAPVAASARAYTTFLNGMRFELFKYMVNNLGVNGQVTTDEAKVIAQYVNVATGRADLGKYNQAMANLNVLFFAPRYVASRFQFLAMPFYLPFNKAPLRVKKVIAKEYARYAMGLGAFLATALAFGSLLFDDDDKDKPAVEFDPRSTDFGKIKIGETRIDPMSGFSQVVTVVSQVATGLKKSSDGEMQHLRGEGHKWGSPTTWDVMASFARKKFAPIPSAATNVIVGENVVGEEVTPLTATRDLFIPLSVSEIKETMQARGVPAGSAITLLTLLGMGGGTYGPKTKYANGTEEERKQQFENDLKKMEWDSPEFPYRDLLNEEQYDQMINRREERKQDLAYTATGLPVHNKGQSQESFEKEIAEQQKAIESVVKAGWSEEFVRQLLRDYAKTRGHKEAIVERIRRTRRIFSTQGK